jgi:hypothetical protein
VRGDAELGGESAPQRRERTVLGAGRPDQGGEVINRPAAAASEAVPASVLVQLQAGVVVVVQSVGPGAVYATEVKGRLKPRLPLLRKGYPGGTGNGG